MFSNGGFGLLEKIAYNHRLIYEDFLFIYATITIIIFIIAIKFYTKNINAVLYIILIYPFCLDAVQIKYFLAESIVLFGSRYLFSKNNSDILKYAIFVIITSTIHISMVFYLSLIIAKILKTKKNKYVICSFVIIWILTSLTDFMSYITKFLNNEKVNAWLLSRARFGWILYLVLVILVGLIAFYVIKSLSNTYSHDYYKMHDTSSKLNKLNHRVLQYDDISLELFGEIYL
ncbi:EpsG family protein [Clostridium estertheticum]|uniref:EpsG family protein n=1 Tax=Clostridium estertheticum TaxID=238834 RepID=UPI001CF270E3|nr:EpsG family protein [Clostridium estertheticum]MCB2339592.1 EpsG family protein [Clostridium estertheticum]